MHLSSLAGMEKFSTAYLDKYRNTPQTIFDLGSMDVNGSYREIFAYDNWNYVGVDLEAGPNVDLVLNDSCCWRELSSNCADVIISGQALEHVDYCWLFFLELQRVLKPGGICCIIAPSTGPEHRYPRDCYRFYPDGMRALSMYAGLETLEVYTLSREEAAKFPDTSSDWLDTVYIGKKPESSGLFGDSLRTLRNLLLRRLSLLTLNRQ